MTRLSVGLVLLAAAPSAAQQPMDRVRSLCQDSQYRGVIKQCPEPQRGEVAQPTEATPLTRERLDQILRAYCQMIPDPCNPNNLDQVVPGPTRPRGWWGGG